MRSGVQAMAVDGHQGGTELGFSRYEKLVEALGGTGIYVENPADLRPALERAFSGSRPSCINVKIDPNGSRELLSASRGMGG
jgi:acetolactate synthase-1/2/3 large subunit